MAGEERPDMAEGDDTATLASHAHATADANATDAPDAPQPALQVIILGSQGGPLETNCTAFLVRSIAAGWRKGSIMAVDAGVHLGAIHQILLDTQPPQLGKTDEYALPYILRTGPFAGLKVDSASAKTNAKKIQGDLIDTYLITHPHLDHISGFVINTAGLAGPRRKKLAGLPGTVQALKTHLFNNVIWPNLSDEDHGAGLFTYMRLNEGGSPAMGNADGYLEFNEGLAVKVWSVSHGHSMDPPRSSQQRIGSGSNSRYGSLDASSGVGGMPMYTGMLSPRSIAHHNASPGLVNLFQQQQQQHQLAHERANSLLPLPSMPSASAVGMGRTPSMNLSGGHSPTEMHCVYDSSSYFIRDVESGVEVLIFGDVEADSISMHPRNLRIWQEAAPKIVSGKLKAILIECSYDDSRPVERLFGHLTPEFLVQELSVLAEEVRAARAQAVLEKAREAEDPRRVGKRKRDGGDEGSVMARRRATRMPTREFHRGDSMTPSGEEPVSPRTMKAGAQQADGDATTTNAQQHQQHNPSMPLTLRDLGRSYTGDSSMSPGTSVAHVNMAPRPPAQEEIAQLEGLKVVIIHMKDTMDDEPPIGELILEELREHEAVLAEEDGVGGGKGLGCEWVISEVGMSLML
ncbi:3',5'-cyclic-nucleotide phosphodiesterase pde1 [Gnomoniopsis smithogilvyi]|uniref:3',5'-cyclic-nucleotide phosphodiesterase pde1 n=1 Tax=Gnomoniopsis smithogilvyi TaxID=1191159 RepID=A0A9W9CW13_9PEZI|nr:3',5'-cyclic-nucleotide phosphodiesterase pde1 [Gnomoniopsis smithogilvyi]